ncbi:MAG: hypothetical protein GXO18_01975 [Aquificae bacterium]|nr:hypothetical protein [Aquificota bacterium]
MKENLKRKAIERLEIAKWCIKKDFISACASNLYFAYFNFFQYVVGEPPRRRWQHIGIAKAFVHKAYRESAVPVELINSLKEAYTLLYSMRITSDYSDELLSEESKRDLKNYISILEEALSYEG